MIGATAAGVLGLLLAMYSQNATEVADRFVIVFGLLFLLGEAFVVAIGLLVAVLWIACEVGKPQRLREMGRLVAGL